MTKNMTIDSSATDLGRPSDSVPAKCDPSPADTSSKAPSSGQTPSSTQKASPRGLVNEQTLGASTQCVHSGEQRQKAEGSITAPIYAASTFTFESTDALLRFVNGEDDREEYGRYGNPNEKSVEAKLAALEGAESAILYSSGMSAIVGLLMAKLSSGDEIVFFDQCYHRSREFCAKHLSRFGVVTHQVPTGDFEALEAAITPRTKMLVSESPTNPHLTTIDLEKFVAVGKSNEVETLIDATLATPFNIKPIAYGVDYVLHSATKYLGGHNDLLAGVICGRNEQLESVRSLRGVLGGVNSPHNLYLLERGLKTFALRMQRHNENGLAIAQFLESHPRVERVYYPGLKSHPSYETAAAQMRGFGGLITFSVKDADWKATSRIVDAAKIPRIAASLGGVESLIEQPLVMSYYHCTPEDRARFGIADNMIRMSCGIEDTDDLIADLKQALQA
ncbi:Methionine gamma-lyase [Novipirellula galeiformis]|uniref:Methionine gamma-lyase n=1 Tax=Novipirellula galeiformis TaxID=2528004 RepID=A0A5C6C323_9BACT|nr:aminotransferase class I/II-fold pyridoxal phosphate-dependent enzyme [Novipirellula galeiformis]TWU17664.1 Methionine gamma-lyase [Novipirellula galeiformis]